MSFRASWIAITTVLLLGLSWGDNSKSQTHGSTPITQSGRFDIIRALDGEQVFVRKAFPMGTKGLVLTPDGKLIPIRVKQTKH